VNLSQPLNEHVQAVRVTIAGRDSHAVETSRVQILHVTDFHGQERWYDWLATAAPRVDLICLTGDLLDLLDYEHIHTQIRMVGAQLGKVSVPLAICSGNHDSFPEDPQLLDAAWLNELRRPSLWIDGDRFMHAGRRFLCIPWNYPPPSAGFGEVWLSHCPPAGAAVSAATGDDDDFGDVILEQLCEAERGPEIVLSGHKHNPANWHCLVGRTHCFNPGCNLHEAMPRHVVIDTTARTAAYSCLGKGVAKIPLT